MNGMNKPDMQGKQMGDKEMQNMQGMSGMMSDMQAMMEEMQSSGDMAKMPEMMAKMGEMMGMMSEMMTGGETIPADEYSKLDAEGKDKADEAEVMGRH